MWSSGQPFLRRFKIEEAFLEERKKEEENFLGRKEYVDPAWSFFGEKNLSQFLNEEMAKWYILEEAVQDFQNYFEQQAEEQNRDQSLGA